MKRILFTLITLLIADTVFGGPLGILFRGERHLLMAAILLVAGVQAIRQLIYFENSRKIPWGASYLWPAYYFFSSLIWVFVVPMYSGGSVWLAIQDAQSLLVLPLASLILYVTQKDELILPLLKYVLWFVAVLALCQDVIWLWVEISGVNPEVYYKFVEQYFNTAESISVFWQPSPSGGYVRVFWISSVWLVVAVFIAPIIFGRYAVFAFEVVIGFAICASYTRGIWLSLLLSLMICTAVIYAMRLWKKKYGYVPNWGMAVTGLCCAIALFSAADYTVRGQAGVLARNIQNVIEPAATDQVVGKILGERITTEDSIGERVVQSNLLISKWKERPLMGFGYGAYMPNHFSHDERPFLYEMLPMALMMKLGIIGFALHIFAFLGLIGSAAKAESGENSKLMFIGASTAFYMAAHTNPILFSAVGMTIILFILIWWREIINGGCKYANVVKEN